MDKHLAQRIKTENIEVHRKEAPLYDTLHSEIFNFYEQKRTINDIIFIAKQISKTKPRALDIGCGTGNLTLKFLERGFHVTGVDITREMIDVLRSKLRSKNQYDDSLKLIECDIDTFISSETEKYDVIAFSSTLHHLPFYVETLYKCINLLNDGGIVYITHEPLPGVKQNLIWKMFAKIDSLLFYLILKLRGIKIPRISYIYSDYHAQKGLDIDRIIENLIHEGCEILKFEKYNVRKFGILSLIENKLNSSKTMFKLIARKSNHEMKYEQKKKEKKQ